MKKTLIAAAVLATSAAYAQSSVEVYGLIDMSVTSTKTTEGTTVTKTRTTAKEGNDSPLRIGFRGTEDLGGGLKAGFVIESGSAIGDRLASLSLSSDMGTVTLGKFWNAFDDVATGLGMGSNIVTISLAEQKASNGIAYKSPEFSGFSFGLGLSQDKSTTDGEATKNNRVRELSLNYENGPLTAMAAFSNAKAVAVEFEAYNYTAEAANPKLTSSAFQVSYDLGFVVPYVIYARDKISSGAITGIADTAGVKSAGYEFGASFPMGSITPFVTVSRAKAKASLDGVESADRFKLSGNQVGVTYSLSKRTTAYAVASRSKNKEGATTLGKKSETAVGIMHTF